MDLKHFVNSLTKEQRDYFVDYLQECEKRAYDQGFRDGRRIALYEVRDKINEEYAL